MSIDITIEHRLEMKLNKLIDESERLGHSFDAIAESAKANVLLQRTILERMRDMAECLKLVVDLITVDRLLDNEDGADTH